MENNELAKNSPAHLFQNYFPSPDEVELNPQFNFENGINLLKQNVPSEKNSVDVHLLYKGSLAIFELLSDFVRPVFGCLGPGRVGRSGFNGRNLLAGFPRNRKTVFRTAAILQRKDLPDSERPRVRQFGFNSQLVQVKPASASLEKLVTSQGPFQFLRRGFLDQILELHVPDENFWAHSLWLRVPRSTGRTGSSAFPASSSEFCFQMKEART